MKKILDCDWLRAVHFKCNTSDCVEENKKFSKPMISLKMMMKILSGAPDGKLR